MNGVKLNLGPFSNLLLKNMHSKLYLFLRKLLRRFLSLLFQKRMQNQWIFSKKLNQKPLESAFVTIWRWLLNLQAVLEGRFLFLVSLPCLVRFITASPKVYLISFIFQNASSTIIGRYVFKMVLYLILNAFCTKFYMSLGVDCIHPFMLCAKVLRSMPNFYAWKLRWKSLA